MEPVSKSFILSHLAELKFFALWGLLESLIYLLTRGNIYKDIFIHVFLFIIITLIAWKYEDPLLANAAMPHR